MSSSQLKASQNNQNISNFNQTMRWDHGGFDQLQQEEQQGKWHKTKGNKKYQHSRDEETQRSLNNNSRYYPDKKEESSSTKVSQKDHFKASKKDKKPDRALYSVRGKRVDNQCLNELIDMDEINVKNNDFSTKTKEEQLFTEDRSFISNVSTNDGRDENKEKILLENDNALGSVQFINQEDNKILLTLSLGIQNDCEMVVIYENEENFEGFLDEICSRHNIIERAALCFKINVLQMICDVHPDPTKVVPILNRLLDTNYNLILSECREEFEDRSSPFCDQYEENSTEDSCNDVC